MLNSLKRSIVAIHLGNEINETLNGTGIVVNRIENAIYVMTARHVLFDNKNSLKNEDIRVEFYSQYQENRQRLRLYAEIVPQSLNYPELDLVLLKVVGGVPKDIEPLKLFPDFPIKGESLRLIGHPVGSLSSPAESEKWQTTLAIVEGVRNSTFSDIQIALPQLAELRGAQRYSGEPVVNSKNELIGIIYKTEPGVSLASAYSVEMIKMLLEGYKLDK